MAQTRDDKFKLAFDMFVKDVIGIPDYGLTNLTKNKSESRHIYEFLIPKQTIIIGFIDRCGVTYTGNDFINMDIGSDNESLKKEYSPDLDVFEKQFNATFEPYKDKQELPSHRNMPYIYYKSYVDIYNCVINEDGDLYGKLCVVYNKKHLPYPLEKNDNEYEKKYITLLKKCNNTDRKLSIALFDIDELQDDIHRYNKQLRSIKKELYRETQNNNLSEMNLINKLHEAYKILPTKEDCPVCYETIENDKLIIPRCSHYICNECHPRCDSCPICRIKYND